MGLITEKRGGDTFSNSGFDNCKKAHQCLMLHEKSVSQQEAVLKHQLMRQAAVEAQLIESKKLEQKRNWEMLLKLYVICVVKV